MEPVCIFWTCGNLDEARKVARMLVEEGLVACANIIPWVESIFLWEGKIDTVQETKVIFKTVKERFDAVQKKIKENARYEVPEILMLPIDEGNPEYLEWMESVLIKSSVL